MKRFLFALLPALLLAAMLFTPAHAKPLTLSCPPPGHPCSANVTWSQTVQGSWTYFTASNPTVSSTGQFLRYEALNTSPVQLAFGIEKDGTNSSSVYCSSYTRNIAYYFYYYNVSGKSGSLCSTIPSSDVGTLPGFQIGFYVSNGGGMFFKMYATNSGFCTVGCFIQGLGTTYHFVMFYENFIGSVTGHQVWGSEWGDSQYDVSSGWFFWNANPSSSVAYNPTQMFWHVDPVHSASGGTLYSCDYETGSTCTLGS